MNKSKQKTKINSNNTQMLFGKKNYKFMFAGLALIIIGFVLMSGGGSNNPQTWNPDIFSFIRIRLAPMVILVGFAIEIYAIMLKELRLNPL